MTMTYLSHTSRSTVTEPLHWQCRVVIFDLGDVLYDATAWQRCWLHKLLLRFGVAGSYEPLARTWKRQYLADVHRGQEQLDTAFRKFLASLGLSSAQIDEVEAAAIPKRRWLQECVQPFPGAVTTLEKLHSRGYVLVGLEDSQLPGEELSRRCRRLGFGQSLSACVSSREVRSVGGEPERFQAVLQTVRMPAEEAVFVGHEQDELQGAAAGLRTVALNTEVTWAADHRSECITDLLALFPPRQQRAAA